MNREIPEPCRCEALAAGLTEPITLAEWAKYTDWSSENYPDLGLGGKSWRRWVKGAVEDLSQPKFTSSEIAMAERRANDASRKRLEDAAYTREAVTFAEWKKQPGATWSGFCASLGLYL